MTRKRMFSFVCSTCGHRWRRGTDEPGLVACPVDGAVPANKPEIDGRWLWTTD